MQESMSLLNAIHTRASVRFFTEQNVSDEQIEMILRAGMAAPSACNKQPWRFVVVRNSETKKTYAETVKYADPVARANVAVVVCGDMEATIEGNKDYWIFDAAAAAENILLAAHGIGLGGVCLGVYPTMERVEFLKNLLKLPENIVPLATLAIGYPEKPAKPLDKWRPDFIHNEQW